MKRKEKCTYPDKDLTVLPYPGAAQVGQAPHSPICPCGSAERFACGTPSFSRPPVKLNKRLFLHTVQNKVNLTTRKD